MPKDKDPLGLLGSGFQTLGKYADPETYRQPMTKMAGLFGRSLSGQPLPKKKPRSYGMAPGSMAKTAKSQGYDVVKNKDGSESYVKSKPKAKQKSKKGVHNAAPATTQKKRK